MKNIVLVGMEGTNKAEIGKEEADYIIDVTDLSIEEVSQKMIEIYEGGRINLN